MTRSRTASRMRWAIVLLGLAAVTLVVLTGFQATRAKKSLELVADDFSTLSDQLTTGDRSGALATLARAQDHAASARHNTRGPGWWLTSKVPEVGPNITAVRTVADVVDTLSADVLPEVVEATQTLNPENLRPEDGRVDLQPIQAVAPGVVAANTRLATQEARVAAIDASELAPQIATPVRLLQTKLADAAAVSDRASRAVRLLPSMLGADGPRTYLLLFQNSAELRSTGGIPGSFATVTADHGAVSIGEQGDAGSIGRFTAPPTPLTSDERALFGRNMGALPPGRELHPGLPALGRAGPLDVERQQRHARSTAWSRPTRSRCPTCCTAPARSRSATAGP